MDFHLDSGGRCLRLPAIGRYLYLADALRDLQVWSSDSIRVKVSYAQSEVDAWGPGAESRLRVVWMPEDEQFRHIPTNVDSLANQVSFTVGSAGVAGLYVLPEPVGLPPSSHGPAAFELHAAPNPLVDRTQLRFRTASAGRVWLRIFDPSGRRVRHLVSGAYLPSGSHVSEWDGRDDAGHRMGPGLYTV
jgi:hypothetical protein